MTTRRDFLKTSIGTSAVFSMGGIAPRFLCEAALRQPADKDQVLVVVQLSGGNDGLNSIVPYKDDEYYSVRPRLGVPSDDVLRIDDDLGFHPALRGFSNLLEQNRLAIVQGVGYERPNRSHFESMDIWHTCQRKGENRQVGWLGRCLDAQGMNRFTDVPAIHFGGEKQPLALASLDVRVPSVRSIENFRLREGGDKSVGEAIDRLAQTTNDKATNDKRLMTKRLMTKRLMTKRRREQRPGCSILFVRVLFPRWTRVIESRRRMPTISRVCRIHQAISGESYATSRVLLLPGCRREFSMSASMDLTPIRSKRVGMRVC